MSRPSYASQLAEIVLNAATLCDSLQGSISPIREALGIGEDDIAWLQFSGEDPIHGLPYEEAWPLLTPEERKEELLAWLRTEDAFRDPDAPVAANEA